MFFPAFLAAALAVFAVDELFDFVEVVAVAAVAFGDVDLDAGELLDLFGLLAVAEEDLQLGAAVFVLDDGVFESLLAEDSAILGSMAWSLAASTCSTCL